MTNTGDLAYLPFAGVPVRGSSSDDPSGHAAAEAAYDAGAVEPVDELPTFDVVVSFPLTAGESRARDLVDILTAEIAAEPEVGVVAVSIVQRQPV